MSVFLAATLTSFAIYCLIAFSYPSWVEGSPAPGRIGWGLPHWLVNTFLVVICVVSSLALIFATFRGLHPGYSPVFDAFDAFTGRRAPSLLLGGITGGLLGAFVSRVLLLAPGSTIEARDKITVALLVVFFVLGIGGEEAIRSLAQRISKVSALGTEIEFADASKSASRANSRGSASTAAVGIAKGDAAVGRKTLGVPGSSYGLAFLSNLGAMIERDRAYSIISVMIKHGDAQVAVGSTKTIEQTLNQPMEFARVLIEPFAECLQTLQAQTGDVDFVNDRLLGLVGELRVLISSNPPDGKMAIRLTDSYFREADILGRFIMRTTLGSRIGRPPEERSDRAKAIGKSCNRFYFLLFEDACWHGSGAPDEKACWQAKKETLRKLEVPDDWIWQQSGIRDFYTNSDDPTSGNVGALDVLPKPLGTSAVNYMRDMISEFANKGSYSARPYSSIIYASIMAQVGRYEAALVELDRWLQLADSKTRNGWYAVRARNTLSILTEEWLRRPSTSVPTVLRQYHINNNEEVASLIRKLLHMEAFRSKHAILPEPLEKSGFSSRPQEHQPCQRSIGEPWDDLSFEQMQRAFATYVTAQLIVAQHALLHPGYPSLYSREVASALKEILGTDLSCAAISNGIDGIDHWRAESLRLYALMKLRDASVIAETKGKDSAASELQLGLDAATLGLEIIYPSAHRDQASIDTVDSSARDEPIFARILPTKAIETLEETNQVRAQLIDARRDLATSD
ncbi:hypothetical protein SSBR45G_07390 [Bradyrhizobium sp. SSBR45G]|uniref:hypothetical protein n=1 Tax=unclassified Bradyrhizobium TaxID=2631580 RepID=UPI0023429192|nr:MULTISPECIES: hypothetical protein [unclassified Bradyrhizobium]GLH75831.1 hypothetical protein SSBR45G_07390 [Bradyrhizobium sp. SSBR45G]GLH85068.1 hypothetical protein SSBR45R_25280 [Bradyrhizobium sp. SSBR45R]